ncbi:MAG: hypothetical protein WCK77_25960, partial [Verrucomicrobiota bacterium]
SLVGGVWGCRARHHSGVRLELKKIHPTTQTMKTTARLIIIVSIIASSLALTGCDGKVTAEQASKAGEILKKWQDQNK